MQPAYDKMYLADICVSQAELFTLMLNEHEHVDVDRYITDYMHSDIRKCLDKGVPRWATNPANELLSEFKQAIGYTVPTGRCRMDYDMAFWIGYFYAEYQWYWNISSADLITWFPTFDLGTCYPGMHSKNMQLIIEETPPDALPRHPSRAQK